MALVKLKCTIPPQFFTDYLCLHKVEGRWHIFKRKRSQSMIRIGIVGLGWWGKQIVTWLLQGVFSVAPSGSSH